MKLKMQWRTKLVRDTSDMEHLLRKATGREWSLPEKGYVSCNKQGGSAEVAQAVLS
jgi:hypothetical protein